jgi:hypothetical protein
MQFWLPFVSGPQAFVAGSCTAARLWARVRFGSGGIRVPSVPVGEHVERQVAYQRSREERRLLIKLTAVMPLGSH